MVKKEFIIGIDDAGRGPIIGPMILAGVLASKEQEKILKDAGVKDSKMLSHGKRVALAEIIKKNSLKTSVFQASPEEIDEFVESKSNLNTLEALKAGEIINALNDKMSKIKVIVDCPSVNTSAWRKKLLEFVKHPDNLDVHCEHKADVNYPVVSAASIIAKVAREDEVAEIRQKNFSFGDIGSGYPSDPATKAFLKKNGKALENSGIFRKSWQTWKDLYGSQPRDKSKKQSSLEDF